MKKRVKLILLGSMIIAMAVILVASTWNNTNKESNPSLPVEETIMETLTEPIYDFIATEEMESESTMETFPSEPTSDAEDTTISAPTVETTTPILDVPTAPVFSGAALEAYNDPDFLAKLLFAEAGGMTWEGQIYTCSAILNFCDYHEKTIWDAGHTENNFAVASYVDSVSPNETQYEVIEYVLDGGRVPEICYFRTDHYHTFGTPVIEVNGHYFSKP